MGAKFVQEENAVTMAVDLLHPDVGSVIELGGQDAKIIIYKANGDTGDKRAIASMNDKCASGTGATIDKCLIKLGIDPRGVADVAWDSTKLHHVAAKCGVFAETDIVNLVKSGIPSREILCSLANAIVQQNLSVLTRGNTLPHKVLLLGGPNTYLRFLQHCWRERIIETWAERGHSYPRDIAIEELIFVPRNSELYAAYGATIFGMHEPETVGSYRGLEPLQEFIQQGRKARLGASAGPPLVASAEERDEFVRRHRVPPFAPAAFKAGERIRGTYVTEYRKALRDSGFDGFRVLLFQQKGGLSQATGGNDGLELKPAFFIALLKAIITGDLINAMGYRIRPYEVEPGATNRALEQCKQILRSALEQRRSTLLALWKCRKILSRIKVNRLQPRPKVSIIGEFWAMTTEGDGNYKLQQFLESEGAEVDVQLVTAWLLYMLWQAVWDTRRRMDLKNADAGRSGLKGRNPRKKLLMLWAADKAVRGVFGFCSKLIDLKNYHLPDMDEIAAISHQYYDNHLRGGEGHMEVGKLIQSVTKKKAHMVVSVKPFGCMHSSGVSDGVQSLITAKYPEAIFSAIETTGDGAANVKSRLQMDLFKARQAARKEFDEVLRARNLSKEQIESIPGASAMNSALCYPKKTGLAGTGARLAAEMLG